MYREELKPKGECHNCGADVSHKQETALWCSESCRKKGARKYPTKQNQTMGNIDETTGPQPNTGSLDPNSSPFGMQLFNGQMMPPNVDQNSLFYYTQWLQVKGQLDHALTEIQKKDKEILEMRHAHERERDSLNNTINGLQSKSMIEKGIEAFSDKPEVLNGLVGTVVEKVIAGKSGGLAGVPNGMTDNQMQIATWFGGLSPELQAEVWSLLEIVDQSGVNVIPTIQQIKETLAA